MPSLSSYDVGKKSFEGRTYTADIEAARKGMELFNTPIQQLRESQRRRKSRLWEPRKILVYGNHEDRIDRAINLDRKLEGLISKDQLGYREAGWEVFDYLDVCTIDGINYSHYFTTGVSGKPVTSARALLVKKHESCVMGHVQKSDIAYDWTASGKKITGLFAGTYYQHKEDYLGPQGNVHWRGIWMLHNVKDGSFDEVPIPLTYLKEKYGSEE